MIISFLSQKGGSGKSTLSTNVAALAAGSISVALVDLDPQASASSWCAVREREDITLETSHPPTLKRICTKLQAAGIQLIVIDTPPHLNNIAAVVAVSDFVVVPLRASAFDLAAAMDTFEMVKGKPTGVVINAIPSNTKVVDPAEEVIKQAGLEIVGRIGQRMAFQHAATSGVGVCELGKSKACDEITEMWNDIAGRI